MVRFPPCTVAESLLGAEKEVTGRKKAGCPWLDGTISAANRMTMALLFLWKMLCLTRIDTAILKGRCGEASIPTRRRCICIQSRPGCSA